MFFKDKVHISEVVKWGIIAGLFESIYIFIAAIVYAKQQSFLFISGKLAFPTSVFLLLLISLSAVVATIIVFAHPIHSALKRHYKDALVTVLITVSTVFVFSFLMFLLYPLIA